MYFSCRLTLSICIVAIAISLAPASSHAFPGRRLLPFDGRWLAPTRGAKADADNRSRPVGAPSAAPGGQSHFRGENVDSDGEAHRAAKIGTVPCPPSQPVADPPRNEPAASPCPVAEIAWGNDYDRAMTRADRENKMLLIYFCDACGEGPCNRFKTETLDDPQIRRKLQDYVCVQVPLDAKITIDGKQVKLLEHAAYREMLDRPGIAIVDFRSDDAKLRGAVVSMFPITQTLWYTPERMAVILELPPGTLTQRTLIYAVRIHPEKPASTDSNLSHDLLEEAQNQAQYQADIRVQGHQFWESRFHRICSRLPDGLSAREVCAESWQGQNLVEAAIECVRCWRLSSGHWSAVRSPNRFFGYDMKRGVNGVWYATGIFGAR